MSSLPLPNPEPIAERLANLEAHVQNSQAQAQAQSDRIAESEIRLMQSERKLRVTWTVSALTAVTMLSIGWHKDAIAQGYGMTLAQAATRIAALETKTASMSVVSATDDSNTSGQQTVRFTGVNVQIVDGTGSTRGTRSGRGNLIIGYNELRTDGSDARTGNHNFVVGSRNNYSNNGCVVFGNQNTASGSWASVLGGVNNTASGLLSSVLGGVFNTASGPYSSVSGGQNNTASDQFSSVLGGQNNTASSSWASVSGGVNNTAGSFWASVSGGRGNLANGYGASVSGGDQNTAGPSGGVNGPFGTCSSVSGGRGNTANGDYSSVSGGNTRSTPNNYNWVAGTQSVQ